MHAKTIAFNLILAVIFSTQVEAKEPIVTGSNYPMSSVGAYKNNPSEEEWYKPGNLRPVIATYHETKVTVQRQLQIMRQNGQIDLSLVLWYVPAAPPVSGQLYRGHHIYSENGELDRQIAENLEALIKEISQLKYRRVYVRLAPQWIAMADTWDQWREDLYQIHWRLLKTVRDHARKGAADSNLDLLFDLAAEQAGLEMGQSIPFSERLWNDYVKAFSSQDTVGLSVAFTTKRTLSLIDIYDRSGYWPRFLALDIYGNEKNQLTDLWRNVLRRRRSPIAPIVILESYYQDSRTLAEIREAALLKGLVIDSILQWPMGRGGRHFDRDFAEKIATP